MATATLHRTGNLPAPSSPFVGRRNELAETRRALSSTRLVTLTGVGGVGKTRLALQFARDVRRTFRDGAWLVELGALTDPTLLAQTVATALGIREQSTRPPVETISDHLADKHLLLVLDNCEHVLEECAGLADAALRAAPNLSIVASSRQPLGLASEQIVIVQPLPVPESAATGSVGGLLSYDAVNLFVTRAAGVLPGFTLTEQNAASVAALCAQMDGLPLAIELAAVRLRAFSPDQVLAQLDERFQLLTGGSRAAEPRQQTLRGLVDWSYQLCSAAEKVMWARLSVFTGDFDLEAAEAVCTDEASSQPTVLHALAGLVDKSIVMREEHASGVRYRLLETIRIFGQERLAEPDQERMLRRKHRDHYRRIIEEACAGLFSADGPKRLEQIRLEHANVRDALAFSLSQPGEATAGMSLAAALWLAWRELGLVAEGRRWLDRLLDSDPAPSPARAQALWANGGLAILQGDFTAAREMLAECSQLADRLGDDSARAYACAFLGQAALIEGDLTEAHGLLQRAAAQFRRLDDPLGTALVLFRQAAAASITGDGDRTSQLAAEMVSLCKRRGAALIAPFGHLLLAVEHWRRADVDAALAEAREAARLHWANHDEIGAAAALEVLAWAAADRGNVERAARLVGPLNKVWRKVDAPLFGYPHLRRHHDDCIARCRRDLGEDQFDELVERGSRVAFDDVIAYALEQSPSASRARQDEHPSPLTRREREVADLVAQGKSNKEIAATLVVSPRTAEAHVEHILTKLAFTSRSQIAAWVIARRAETDG